MSGTIERLHEIASSPRAQLDKYLAEGRQAVGVAPVYTPYEIIHSMGLVPMGVWGADTEISEAKQYFPAFICSVMQTMLELGIRGGYKGLSALVVPSLCDSLKALGQNWKYAVKDIPFIPMTYPQNRKPSYGIRFTEASYERVISDLERITGKKFSESALRQSELIFNEHSLVMRKFASLASEKKISAAQRSDVFKSSWFMLPEEHTELVRKLVAEMEEWPDDKSSVRIVTSGILADAPGLLDIFDRTGFKIVYDDVAAESRQYRTDTPIGEKPLNDLAVKFAETDNCSVLYDSSKKRAGLIVEKAAEHGAAGVVILLAKFCDPEEFDFVPVKRACDAAGLPCIALETDRQMEDYGQAATALEAFGEMLR